MHGLPQRERGVFNLLVHAAGVGVCINVPTTLFSDASNNFVTKLIEADQAKRTSVEELLGHRLPCLFGGGGRFGGDRRNGFFVFTAAVFVLRIGVLALPRGLETCSTN